MQDHHDTVSGDSSSVMTDETGGNNEEEIISPVNRRGIRKVGSAQTIKPRRENGLISLSFEGNVNISDRGAEAIANLIQTQS